jgi:hypothetical protein
MAVDGNGSAANSVQGDGSEENSLHDISLGATGRPRRTAAVHGTNGWASKGTRSRRYNSIDDEMDEDEDEPATDFDGDDENDDDAQVSEDDDEEEDDYDEDEAMVEDDLEDHLPRSRIVKVIVPPSALRKILRTAGSTLDTAKPKPISHDDDTSPEVDMQDAPSSVSRDTEEREEISVSIARQSTPEHAIKVAHPLTPSGMGPTSLAFRGSPEKPQAMARPIDVGFGE